MKKRDADRATAVAEAEHLTQLGFGAVRGVGAAAAPVEVKEADVDKQLGARLMALGGLSESGAARAVAGREVTI
jgi:hypothetical protein